MKPEIFYSNGKLLLTGEYVVLDGALSLAVPTKFGQSLSVEIIEKPMIHWKSFDEKGSVWFEREFQISEILDSAFEYQNDVAQRISQILKATHVLNPDFLSEKNGFSVSTKLDFPKDWGLGTSSTLINNIANWSKVDAYELLSKTFGGSGYDIACAQHEKPITYQLISGVREIKEVNFQPKFKGNIHFVHLNKKQNSRDAIAHYKSHASNFSEELSTISDLTSKMIACETLKGFQNLMDFHENIISEILKMKPIKEVLFSDFEGSIKSLGGWGGDFIMVASEKNPEEYFSKKGFKTILNYSEIVK